MADRNNIGVSYKLSKNFFNNFEKRRKEVERKIGTSLSQTKFTEYLYQSRADIKIPKQNKTYFPKVKRKGFGGFRII